jgi:hypothetical protein
MALLGMVLFLNGAALSTDLFIYGPPLGLWTYAIIVYSTMLLHRNLLVSQLLFLPICIIGPLYYQYILGGLRPSAGIGFFMIAPLLGSFTMMPIKYTRYYFAFALVTICIFFALDVLEPQPTRLMVARNHMVWLGFLNISALVVAIYMIAYLYLKGEYHVRQVYKGQLSAINNTLCMVELTKSGRIKRANNLFAALINLNKEHLKGHYLEEFVDYSINNFKDLDAELNEILRRQDRTMRIGLQNKAGKVLHFLSTFTVLYSETGEFNSILMLASDVTSDRLKVENLGALYEVMDKQHNIMDLDLNGRIVGSNMTFVRSFDTSVSAMMASGLNNIMDFNIHKPFDLELLIKRVVEIGFITETLHLKTESLITKTFDCRFYLIKNRKGNPFKITVIMDLIESEIYEDLPQ